MARAIRLGATQRAYLGEAAAGWRRASAGNPTFRRLTELGLVTGRQHISARTGRPTVDREFAATDLGRTVLAEQQA